MYYNPYVGGVRLVRITLLLLTLLVCGLSARAQVDTLSRELGVVTVEASRQAKWVKHTPQIVEWVGTDFLHRNFTGQLAQTLQNLPGIHAMNIGGGSSKFMIRGMAFNRVAFVSQGVKQENQQWGADHGLDFDAFDAEEIVVLKGASSLVYGSDAMGGVVQVQEARLPKKEGWQSSWQGALNSWGRSVDLSSHVMYKRRNHFASLRLSWQDMGDMRVPTDTIYYLSRAIPLDKGYLKNTASGRWSGHLSWQNSWQGGFVRLQASDVASREGFFPGSHGFPDLRRLGHDGSHRNIELPSSRVNHLHLSSTLQWQRTDWTHTLVASWQYNHRQELSAFHTHYPTQEKPQQDPDTELRFDLYTNDLKGQHVWQPSTVWKATFAWDAQWQANRIGGYSFLLPRFDRLSMGGATMLRYTPSNEWTWEGGLRYDYAHLDVRADWDPYLASYLKDMGYDAQEADRVAQRSQPIDRHWANASGAIGLVWHPMQEVTLKGHLGRSFRVPTPIELSANGVHHASFRHEVGSADLKSEKGWTADLDLSYSSSDFDITLAPYANYFSHYIYLAPMGQWSQLPHAGQIYRYLDAEAVISGIEFKAKYRLSARWEYELMGDYTYTYNLTDALPLPASPPARVVQSISYTTPWGSVVRAGNRFTSSQKRIARNEEVTPNSSVWEASISHTFIWNGEPLEVTFSGHNLLNAKYYNHLSYYRKLYIPEAGLHFRLHFKYSL